MNREEKDKYIIELVKEKKGKLYFKHIIDQDYIYNCCSTNFDITFENFYRDPINNSYIEEYYIMCPHECGLIMPILYYLTLKYYDLFGLCLKENILDYVDNCEFVLMDVLNMNIPLMKHIGCFYHDLRQDYKYYKTYDINNKHLKFVVKKFLEHSNCDVNKRHDSGKNILMSYFNSALEDNDIYDIIMKQLNIDNEEKGRLLIYMLDTYIQWSEKSEKKDKLSRRIFNFLDKEYKNSIFFLGNMVRTSDELNDYYNIREFIKCKRQQLVVFRKYYRKNILKKIDI
jgi:hypothetical protein